MGVKLNKDVLQQVEELEEDNIKEEILPALSNDIALHLEPSWDSSEDEAEGSDELHDKDIE